MNPSTKIKVNRDSLVTALKARRAVLLAEYEANVATYDDRLAAYQSAQVEFFQSLADAARVGKSITGGGWSRCRVDGVEVDDPEPPSKPSKSRDLNALTAAIAQLEMATDDTLSISVEDFGKYLGEQ